MGDAFINLGRSFLPQERKQGRDGAGGGVGEKKGGGALFPFDVTQAESQSAHVNELENAIKNIYILETVIQNLM